MKSNERFSVFEYLYRDAGNWKVWGQLLLKGAASTTEIASLVERFESGEFFIAEQMGIPTLFHEFRTQFGGPTPDDHPWHEFAGIRAATEAEINGYPIWGTMKSLIHRANSIENWSPPLIDRT